MLLSSVFEGKSREDLMNEILDWVHKYNNLRTLITGCGEELHSLGCTNLVLLEQVELNVPARSLGYHLGDYNVMRAEITKLKEEIRTLREDRKNEFP